MNRPPAPHPDAANGIAAILGVLLHALLSAILGRRAVRPRDAEYSGMLGAVLRAQADTRTPAEPWEEWIAVPAPWRAARLLPARHARTPSSRTRARPAARMRGPPAPHTIIRAEPTGIA